MNLGQTGLLPEKKPNNPDVIKIYDVVLTKEAKIIGYNNAIDQISQIPFAPVKFVEVDEEKIILILKEHEAFRNDFTVGAYETLAHALASTMDRWMKEVIR